jgi:hypothetical protein
MTQNKQYGIWMIQNNTTKQITYSLINSEGMINRGKTINEIQSLYYVSKNTKNKINQMIGLIGVNDINNFSSELICESDNKKMMLKTKKHLLR